MLLTCIVIGKSFIRSKYKCVYACAFLHIRFNKTFTINLTCIKVVPSGEVYQFDEPIYVTELFVTVRKNPDNNETAVFQLDTKVCIGKLSIQRYL